MSKKKIDDINVAPSKRIYLSIIADYHLNLALCELIDNAIDNWTQLGRGSRLEVDIELNYEQQAIVVKDNSGGIKPEEIHLVVSPGYSKNNEDDQTIGLFGVGSKRAVVALAQQVKIQTRFKKGRTLLVEFDDSWISDPNWELPCYEIPNITEGSTFVELFKLRDSLKQEEENLLIDHLGATYSQFLQHTNINIKLNGIKIKPIVFDSWSFPPGFEPKQFTGKIAFEDSKEISASIVGGLTKSGDPSKGEYGVYVYCNDRLVARAYKGYEVGFRTGKAGYPHPSLSLVRVIVKLNGPAQSMPWNSSKSDINSKSKTFKEIVEHIERILTYFGTLSKKWSGEWEEKVFSYTKGKIAEEAQVDMSSKTKLYLPPIPRIKTTKFSDKVKANNKSLAREKPWVVGLYETVIAVDEITSLRLEQKNRIALLTLDSMLEIAFKEYLLNESGISFSAARFESLMKDRTQVHSEIKNTLTLNVKYWKKIEYYYKLRCELVHKRANVTITDSDLRIFRETVEYVLKKMFKLNFS